MRTDSDVLIRDDGALLSSFFLTLNIFFAYLVGTGALIR
jgi:hypothetical protein